MNRDDANKLTQIKLDIAYFPGSSPSIEWLVLKLQERDETLAEQREEIAALKVEIIDLQDILEKTRDGLVREINIKNKYVTINGNIIKERAALRVENERLRAALRKAADVCDVGLWRSQIYREVAEEIHDTVQTIVDEALASPQPTIIEKSI